MKTAASRGWLNMLKGAGVCVVLLSTGCSTTNSLIHNPSALIRDPGSLVGRPKVEKNITKIVALWEPSNGTGIDEKPARGFAGQILFFGPNSRTGCRVRGTVNIYEFDNYDSESDADLQPLHTFSFHPDSWEAHRSEGTLGHSYSCFIPYMNKHRNQVNCGLRVELIQESGTTVKSEIVEVMLPSRSAASRTASTTRGFVRESQIGGGISGSGVQPASHALPQPPTRSRLESVTIPLPRRSPGSSPQR